MNLKKGFGAPVCSITTVERFRVQGLGAKKFEPTKMTD